MLHLAKNATSKVALGMNVTHRGGGCTGNMAGQPQPRADPFTILPGSSCLSGRSSACLSLPRTRQKPTTRATSMRGG